jgi:hypothetical protein
LELIASDFGMLAKNKEGRITTENEDEEQPIRKLHGFK